MRSILKIKYPKQKSELLRIELNRIIVSTIKLKCW